MRGPGASQIPNFRKDFRSPRNVTLRKCGQEPAPGDRASVPAKFHALTVPPPAHRVKTPGQNTWRTDDQPRAQVQVLPA